jgi:hypothetical protein
VRRVKPVTLTSPYFRTSHHYPDRPLHPSLPPSLPPRKFAKASSSPPTSKN